MEASGDGLCEGSVKVGRNVNFVSKRRIGGRRENGVVLRTEAA